MQARRPRGEPELDEGSVAAEEAADEVEPEEEAPAEAEAEEVAEAARRLQKSPVARRARRSARASRSVGRRSRRIGSSPSSSGSRRRPPLIVSDLLTRSDIREVTQYAGELQETTLDGIEPSPQYNAIRLSAGEAGYGAALQVWQFDEMRQATNHFRRLRRTYFDQNVDGTPVANEAFQASFFGLEHYAFPSPRVEERGGGELRRRGVHGAPDAHSRAAPRPGSRPHRRPFARR